MPHAKYLLTAGAKAAKQYSSRSLVPSSHLSTCFASLNVNDADVEALKGYGKNITAFVTAAAMTIMSASNSSQAEQVKPSAQPKSRSSDPNARICHIE